MEIPVNDPGLPQPQGLYDPAHEHDACGVGFVANIKGRKSHAIVQQGLQILRNLTHRGATGADPLAGTPEEFARTIAVDITKWAKVVKAAGVKVE